MMNFRARMDYEQRLRRIALLSSDVLTGEVAGYIEHVATTDSVSAKRWVFNEHKALVPYLPKEFVNFALSYVITNPEEHDTLMPFRPLHSRFEEAGSLGIEERSEFSPPSALQGPFLYTLQQNEDEGLRLVQTLTNTAIKNWRVREQNRRHG